MNDITNLPLLLSIDETSYFTSFYANLVYVKIELLVLE